MIIENNNKLDYFFTELHHFKVMDENGHIIGYPSDEALLSLENFSLNSLIVFKGILEEVLGEMIDTEIDKIHEITKVLVPISNLKAIDPVNRIFILNVSIDEIKQIDSNFSAPAETIKYSDLKKYPVFTKDDIKLGRIIDIHYYEDTCKFIITKTRLENLFSSIFYFKKNRHFVVPEELIEHLLDKIRIDKTKKDLITNYSQLYIEPLNLDKSYKKGHLPSDSRGMGPLGGRFY